MKLSPKKQKSRKSYPNFKEYKSKFMIASFTLGMALTPVMLTSCNSKPTRNPGTMRVINKDNSKEKAVTSPKADKDNSKDKTVAHPKDDKNIKKPRRTGGVMYKRSKDIKNPPCDNVEKSQRPLGQQAVAFPKADKDNSKDKTLAHPKDDKNIKKPRRTREVRYKKNK